MENKAIFLNYTDEKASLGQSKFFGAPDLPDGFDWPCDEDEFDMEFICQINLASAHKLNPMLPDSGMLYFFGCIANPLGFEDAPKIEKGFQSMANFGAIYSNEDINNLQYGEIVDENGEDCGFAEIPFELTTDEGDNAIAFHQLLGDFPVSSNEIDDYTLLFCLDSFAGDDFTLEFEDSGYLYFLIKKDDLAKKDFSKVICYLISE